MPKWSVGMNLVIFIVFVIFASASSLRADVTGSIQGVVKDRSEASVANAKVVVMNVEPTLRMTPYPLLTVPFRFLALPVGTYKLTVTATRFRPFIVTDIVIKVNDQLRPDVTLDVGSIHDQELVFQEKRLRDQGTDATRSEQPGQRGDRVDNKNGHRAGISVEVGELK